MDGPSPTFCWGAFEAHPAARVLRRKGADISLEPKAYDVLVYLIQHRDRVVSKEELLDKLWPGRVVGDATVNQCVLKIRQAVDEGGQDSVIQTVRGHGFRFTAAVQESAGVDPGQGSAGKSRVGVIAAAAVLLAILGGFAVTSTLFSAPATIAVAKFNNAGQQADQDWLEFGLMSLVSDSLTDFAELSVVPSGTVAQLLLNQEVPDPRARLSEGIDARYVLSADVEVGDAGYRLHYTLWDGDQPVWRDSVSGGDVAELVEALSVAVGDNLQQSRRDSIPAPRLSRIPFVNELFARGRQASIEGDLGQARRYLELVLKEDPGLVYAQNDLARVLRLQGELDNAKTQSQAVIDESRRQGISSLQASAMTNLALILWREGDYAGAEALVSSASELHRAAGELIEAAHDLNVLGILTGQQGRGDEAWNHYTEAMAIFEQAGDQRGIAKTLNNMAFLADSQRNDRLSMELNQQALAIQQRLHLKGSVALTLNNLGVSAAALGQFSSALDHYEQALALRIEMEDLPGQITSLGNVGSTANSLGMTSYAVESTRGALELALTQGSPEVEALARIKLGEALIGTGAMDQARQEFKQAQALYSELGLKAALMETSLYLANLALIEGLETEAQTHLDAAGKMMPDVAYPGLHAWHARLRASLHRQAGQLEAARQALDQGLRLAAEAGDERTRAELAVEGVWLQLELGAIDEARRHLQSIEAWRAEFFPAIAAGAGLLYEDGRFSEAFAEQARARELAAGAWTDDMEARLLAYREAAQQQEKGPG